MPLTCPELLDLVCAELACEPCDLACCNGCVFWTSATVVVSGLDIGAAGPDSGKPLWGCTLWLSGCSDAGVANATGLVDPTALFLLVGDGPFAFGSLFLLSWASSFCRFASIRGF